MISKRILVVGSSSLLSLVAGSLGGYFFAKRQMTKAFSQELEAQIEATKNYYRRLYKREEFATPESATEALGVEVLVEEPPAAAVPGPVQLRGLVEKLKYHTVPQVSDKNVFDMADRGYPIPNEPRSSTTPYVISHDEFNDGEVGYPQATLTYYKGDETLADESEEPVDNVNDLVGVRSLSQFGHLSNDPNVVYVRNEKLGMDFEVVLHTGKYSEEVAGLGSDNG